MAPATVCYLPVIRLRERARPRRRWVRNSAFEVLGPFIHALVKHGEVDAHRDVLRDLVRIYCSIPSMGSALDPDVVFACAFNLPAVILAAGPARFVELGLADLLRALVRRRAILPCARWRTAHGVLRCAGGGQEVSSATDAVTFAARARPHSRARTHHFTSRCANAALSLQL
jgi:hypothetical protein